uniref:NADH dehydrogenase subunit 6 n=1 Tax=Drabescus ineffectus TaxID=2754845 RepID=A0A7G3XWE9_9HEMI|nr:NADH dehydrogenase subunit 6 [Drabescus ineffectus]QLJ57903.1 NADH dehydrogenase subunit 6 [Drabescus ineffectus]
MKMMLIKITIIIYSSIIVMKTPMSLGMMLLLQTFFSTILMSKMLSSSWLTFIMFLMMVGGLLILFMYMSSIASNEKFKVNMSLYLILIILALPFEELTFNMIINEKQTIMNYPEAIYMSKIFNKSGMIITFMMFCYLILTMISVIKIIKIYKGPLRSFNTYE